MAAANSASLREAYCDGVQRYVFVSNARWLLISLAVLLLDQWSKYQIALHFDYREVLAIFSVANQWGVNLTLAHNTGAAFSFLAQAGGWQRWVFAAIALSVSGGLSVWLLRLPAAQKCLALSLSLLIGGALGNLYDRAALGYVIDFIDAYYGDYHWPAFNVADSAICVGAVLLFLETWLDGKNQTQEKNV